LLKRENADDKKLAQSYSKLELSMILNWLGF
jgi:hypothetical protein